MAKVDDLLERRAKQVVLAIVARLAHRSPPTANLAVEGITDRPNRESQTARKPACTPGFLAKSITCSGQIIAIDQSLPNSSRTTSEHSPEKQQVAKFLVCGCAGEKRARLRAARAGFSRARCTRQPTFIRRAP